MRYKIQNFIYPRHKQLGRKKQTKNGMATPQKQKPQHLETSSTDRKLHVYINNNLLPEPRHSTLNCNEPHCQ